MGEPTAKMEWAHYFHSMVQCYKVVVEGWLPSIPFTNLSAVSNSLPQLELLHRKWVMGELIGNPSLLQS